jgi:hypothetical protein
MQPIAILGYSGCLQVPPNFSIPIGESRGYDLVELSAKEIRILDGLPYFEPEPSDAEQYAVTF